MMCLSSGARSAIQAQSGLNNESGTPVKKSTPDFTKAL